MFFEIQMPAWIVRLVVGIDAGAGRVNAALFTRLLSDGLNLAGAKYLVDSILECREALWPGLSDEGNLWVPVWVPEKYANEIIFACWG
jgi:hypothetical protein